MIPMFKHQKDFVDFAESKNFCCLNLGDIGVGKTRMGIETFKRLREKNPNAHLLVICPLSLIESAWIEDLQKFAPWLTYSNLRKYQMELSYKTGERKLADVLLINYEGFITKNFQAKFKDYLENQIVDIFCILDESSKIKNNSSLTTKTIMSWRNSFKWRMCASATPAPNVETEYWGQIEFCVPGTLHPSFHGFKNNYFHLSRGKQSLPNGSMLGKAEYAKMFASGWKYQITPEKKRVLMQRIAAISFRCNKDECLDLPETTDEVRLVEMGSVQRRHYTQMKNDLITEIKSEAIVAQVALVKIMKLRQICSGHAITPDSSVVEIGENPKMAELLSVLEECGDSQVIIWAHFHFEIDGIVKVLGNKARALYSLTEEKDETIRGFKNNEFQYLVAHPRSAGHGHTFVNSSVEIFYSLDYSFETYEQARGRVHRAGQTQKCTYVHLICADSIEEAILSCLRRKADAFELLNEVLK